MNFWMAVQAGAAAAVAWIAAQAFLASPTIPEIGEPSPPVFAPIVAVGTLVSSYNARLRSLIELLVGIILGIGVGDVLISIVGTGAWQLAMVVSLAVIFTTALTNSGSVITQAATTSVLIVVLTPVQHYLEAPRVVEAVSGALSALLVVLLIPSNPLRVVNREVAPLMTSLADALDQTGKALRTGELRAAQEALFRLRQMQDNLPAVHDAIDAGRETITLSPLRWRRRAVVRRFVEGAEYLHRITINTKGLVRRTVTMISDREPVPRTLPDAFRLLAEAVRVLHHELCRGLEPQASRIWTQRALHEVGRAQEEGLALSGSFVVAQLRTIASDVLRAGGLDEDEDQANRVVRESVAAGTQYESRRDRASEGG